MNIEEFPYIKAARERGEDVDINGLSKQQVRKLEKRLANEAKKAKKGISDTNSTNNNTDDDKDQSSSSTTIVNTEKDKGKGKETGEKRIRTKSDASDLSTKNSNSNGTQLQQQQQNQNQNQDNDTIVERKDPYFGVSDYFLSRFNHPFIHPSVLRLGQQYATGTVVGTDARCASLLLVMIDLMADYASPTDTPLGKVSEMMKWFSPHFDYLTKCRIHNNAMGNVVRMIKNILANCDNRSSDQQNKELVINSLYEYLHERIILSAQLIAKEAASKINDGDVILTYGRSNLIEKAIIEAYKQQKKHFSVIIVDGRPLYEGKRLLKNLITKEGLPADIFTYASLDAISYVIKNVNKVILGASSLLSNGSMVSRSGCALVAMCANRHNIPVIVCAETYKFSEKVGMRSNIRLQNTHNYLERVEPVHHNEVANRLEVLKGVDRYLRHHMDKYAERDNDDFYAAPRSSGGGKKGGKNPQKKTGADAKGNNTINPIQTKMMEIKEEQGCFGSKLVENSILAKIMELLDKEKHIVISNPRYDITPMKYISIVVTEVGNVPPTSVPVIIREYRKESEGAIGV